MTKENIIDGAKNAPHRSLYHALGLTKEELEKTMDPSKYTGRASVQVDAFLKNVVNPVLEANKEALGMTAEINV